MQLFRMLRLFTRRESGQTLLETLVALAILGITAVTFLTGVSTSSKVAFIADERATAENLARSQMEWAKSAAYSYNATGYSAAPILDADDYVNYSVNITAEPLHDPDDGIQKIIVTVNRTAELVFTLEAYKVDR